MKPKPQFNLLSVIYVGQSISICDII